MPDNITYHMQQVLTMKNKRSILYKAQKNPTDLGEGLGIKLSAAVKCYRLLLLEKQTNTINNRQKAKSIQYDYQPK